MQGVRAGGGTGSLGPDRLCRMRLNARSVSEQAHAETRPTPAAGLLSNEFVALAVLAAGLVVCAIAAPISYTVYLMIHIFTATVWVGGGTTIAILAFMIERTRDPVLLGRFAELTGKVGMRVYMPSSLILLIFGFVLVDKGSWGYGHFWVIFAIAGWAASFLIGILLLRPLAEQVGKIVPQRGLDDPESQRLLRRIILIDRWQVVVLLLVVADMAAKPFA